jgi:uncharacterized protein (DUF2147 family)
MQIKSFLLFLSLGMWLLTSAEMKNNPDRIAGYYYAEDAATGQSSQIEIYRAADGKYYGKVVWLQEPNENGRPKVDVKNPDQQLRNRPMLGIPLLKGFSYVADNDEWSGGTIYNPASGKTYHCIMKFDKKNRLKIHGYIGAAWMGLGETVYWPKEAARRK